ncbi:MAG: helix-hairpin-helix domain-containing protein [Patescibacteria group bacterium]
MKPKSKEFTNLEIAELLRDVAASYQLQNKEINKFKIIAYERAATAIEHASSELKDLWDEGKLKDVPGIGEAIAEHLDELFRTGHVKHFEELMKDYPKIVFRLLKIQGIGPKTAYKLVSEGAITKEVKEELREVEEKPTRHLLPYATERATEVITWLKKITDVKRVDPLGSLRRKTSTIGDIDIAVATDRPDMVINHFVNFPKIQKIIEKGAKTASILLPGDVRVDLMVQSSESYGSLLQHFTGSKHHNIALRELALKKGFSLSEYGLKQLKTKNEKLKTFKTEEELFNFLGFEYIPPELREDVGELESKLPKLVEKSDINADLHIHSDFDIETSHDLGISSMEEIIKEANTLNYKYLTFTEHNPSRSKHSEKEIVEILKMKREKVEQLNYSGVMNSGHRVQKVFNSLEIDILPDGSCPIPSEGFDYLDFALVSIHSSFNLSKDQMTQRVIKALSWHPKALIFAHPTTRKLNEREGVELDWPEIFDFCLKNNKWLEINADPMRLDLPDFLVRDAVKAGVKLTLGTDAHDKEMLKNMIYGVSVARRGWCEKKNVVNCLSLSEFEKLLKEVINK